jgi:phosphopantothenoylcysteine decarboxylase/phosphopantothenate--cysteine ligase
VDDLLGVRVLVTAGGTREPIDSVRFIGNRSSGRMGFALARAAAARGADVTVIAANAGALPEPAGARRIDVETAAELAEACKSEFGRCDVLLMAAAVADFRPAVRAEHKIKKDGGPPPPIGLEPTEDVLSSLAGSRRAEQTLVGFAAEHGDGAIAYGRGKLERKRLDAIVVNDISRADIGFDVGENEVTIVTAAGERLVGRTSKELVAEAVLDEVVALRAAAAGGVDGAHGPLAGV